MGAEKASGEMQKAVENALAAADAAKKEKEAREEKKRKRAQAESAKTQSTPKKARQADKSSPASGKKSAPVAKSGKAAAPEPDIPKAVLSEAIRLGMEAALKNLVCRPEIAASKKSARAVMDALKSSKGLVNPAKHALLGK